MNQKQKDTLIENLEKMIKEKEEDRFQLDNHFAKGTFSSKFYIPARQSIKDNVKTLKETLDIAKENLLSFADEKKEPVKTQELYTLQTGMIVEYHTIMNPRTRLGIIKEILFIEDHIDKSLIGTYCYTVSDIADINLAPVRITGYEITNAYKKVNVDLPIIGTDNDEEV